MRVPAFSYRDQDGRRLTNRDLLGHPWIADFVFTRCAGPCHVITARLGELRRRLPSARLRFVSFSVDPEHDVPAVLKAYAAHFGGDADGRWRLLSTNWPPIGPLAGAMHAVALAPDAANASSAMIVHSDRFVLVDATGQARATVDSGDPKGLEWLIATATALDANTSGNRFALSNRVP